MKKVLACAVYFGNDMFHPTICFLYSSDRPCINECSIICAFLQPQKSVSNCTHSPYLLPLRNTSEKPSCFQGCSYCILLLDYLCDNSRFLVNEINRKMCKREFIM